MGNSWKSLPDRGLKNGKVTRMRAARCTVCSNETYQEDCICVLCRNYITRMHEELVALLAIDKKRKIRKMRIKAVSKSRISRNFR
jgi:hypothetical protein